MNRLLIAIVFNRFSFADLSVFYSVSIIKRAKVQG